jgi:hypothetical protein
MRTSWTAAAPPDDATLSVAGYRPPPHRPWPWKEFFNELWETASPGDPVAMVRDLVRGIEAIGDAWRGKYNVTPEVPGQWSEMDEFRQQLNDRELEKRLFGLATMIVPDAIPIPSIAARPLNLPRLPRGASVTGIGPNGPIVEGLEGRPQDAFSWLRQAMTGDVKGVLDHPEIPGRIDVIQGNPRGGLLHIDNDHSGAADRLPEVWDGLKAVTDSPNRTRLSSDQGSLSSKRISTVSRKTGSRRSSNPERSTVSPQVHLFHPPSPARVRFCR